MNKQENWASAYAYIMRRARTVSGRRALIAVYRAALRIEYALF